MTAPKKKFCHRCKRIKGLKGWTCRGCGAKCCAHFCHLKDGAVASCGTCKGKGAFGLSKRVEMPSSTRTMHGVAFTRDDYQDWRAQVNGHEIVLRKCTNGGGAGTMWAAIIDPARNVPGPARDGKLIGSWPKLSEAASRAIVTAEAQES